MEMKEAEYRLEFVVKHLCSGLRLDVCPNIVVDSNDPVDHNPQIGGILSDLVEKPGQFGCTIRNHRIVLNVFRREELGHRLFSLLLVDHQIVKRQSSYPLVGPARRRRRWSSRDR